MIINKQDELKKIRRALAKKKSTLTESVNTSKLSKSILDKRITNLIEEGKVETIGDRKKSANVVRFIIDKFGEFDPELFDTVRYDDDMFEYEGETWLVLDDDEADARFDESQKDLFDDIGFDGFINSPEQYLKPDWFEETMKESTDAHIDIIRDENSSEYENRLIEELVDNGFLTDDDFVTENDYDEDDEEYDIDDDYINYEVLNDDVDLEGAVDQYRDQMNDNYSDPIEWFRDNFGEDEISNVIKSNPHIFDFDEASADIKRYDGRGPTLNHVDGNEEEYSHKGNTYYYYKQ